MVYLVNCFVFINHIRSNINKGSFYLSVIFYKNNAKIVFIFNYFLDGSSFGVKIYYHKEDKPRGTAGALLDVLDSLNNQFFVIYGDTFLNVDLI